MTAHPARTRLRANPSPVDPLLSQTPPPSLTVALPSFVTIFRCGPLLDGVQRTGLTKNYIKKDSTIAVPRLTRPRACLPRSHVPPRLPPPHSLLPCYAAVGGVRCTHQGFPSAHRQPPPWLVFIESRRGRNRKSGSEFPKPLYEREHSKLVRSCRSGSIRRWDVSRMHEMESRACRRGQAKPGDVGSIRILLSLTSNSERTCLSPSDSRATSLWQARLARARLL